MFQVACLVFLARFPRFCWQYCSVCTTSPIHSARKTHSLLYLSFWKKNFSSSIVVSLAKPNRCLLKTPAIFLHVLSQNFRQYVAIETALIWLVFVGFFYNIFFANQKAVLICTRVTSLHSCYRRAALLFQLIRIEWFFRVYYYNCNVWPLWEITPNYVRAFLWPQYFRCPQWGFPECHASRAVP